MTRGHYAKLNYGKVMLNLQWGIYDMAIGHFTVR